MKLVSVIMAVHNGEPYLAEAVESILGQTFADFDFVIVDDGSTDGSAEVVLGYADPRIRLLRNPANLGLIASLNRAVEAADGVYLARMDADDVSLPGRFTEQVAFLERHPEVGVLGAGVQMFGVRDGSIVPAPADPGDLACALPFHNPLAHPTAMLRGAVLRRAGLRYDPSFVHAEDYELWTRCAEVSLLANLPEILLRYRTHAANISVVHAAAQRATADRIRRRELLALGLVPSAAEEALHGAVAAGVLAAFEVLAGHLDDVERWLLRLREANRRRLRYPEPAFARYLGKLWDAAGAAAVAGGSTTRERVEASPLRRAELTPFERALLSRRRITRTGGR